MNFDQKTFSHIPMRNETLVINNICITLCKLGDKDEALDLYRITLEKMKSSKVKIKYRYRSYQILFNNYLRECGEIRDSLKELQMEFLCGKAMELPFCINTILQILSQNGVSESECDEWAKAAYYIFDLFYFESNKKMFREFFEKNRNIEVIN